MVPAPDATPPLPRIFISELDVSDLSNAARATIEAYVGGTGDGEHGMLFSTQSASAALPYDTRRGARKKEKKKSKVRYPGAFADPDFHKDTFECVLDLIEDVYATAGDHAAGVASHMCCDGWDTPWDVRGIAKADFDLLTNESEYAAWTLVNGEFIFIFVWAIKMTWLFKTGYAVNHVAIAAHRLPLESGIGDLRSLNAFLQGDVPAARLVPVTPPGDSPGPGDSPAVSDSEDDAEKAVIRREIGGYGEIPEERCFSERWEKFGEDGLYRFIVDPVACPTSGGPPNEWNDFEDEDDQTVDQTEPGSGVDAFTRVSPDGGLLQSSISADVRLVKLFDERVGSLVECAVPGGYLEFVQRRPLDPNAISANVPAQSLGDSALRDGFHEGNANGIFESTFRANTHPRAKGAADAGKGGGGEVGKGAKSSAVSWSLRRVRSAEKRGTRSSSTRIATRATRSATTRSENRRGCRLSLFPDHEPTRQRVACCFDDVCITYDNDNLHPTMNQPFQSRSTKPTSIIARLTTPRSPSVAPPTPDPSRAPSTPPPPPLPARRRPSSARRTARRGPN